MLDESRVLDAIHVLIRKQGKAPTTGDIAAALNISSKNGTLFRRIVALRNAGLVAQVGPSNVPQYVAVCDLPAEVQRLRDVIARRGSEMSDAARAELLELAQGWAR